MPHVAVRAALVAVVLGLAAGVLPVAARAQAAADEREHWHPGWGDWSLSFFLPDGGGAGLGVWKQRSPRLALGLRVSGAFDSQTQTDPILGDVTVTSLRASLGPAAKWYWWQQGPVSPFLHGSGSAFYDRTEAPGGATWRLGGGIDAGIGADWFPAEGVSIGGHTGVGLSYLLLTDDDDATGNRTAFHVGLFTSVLTLHLYF